MRRDAIKLLQVTDVPPVLTLHLKRFATVGRSVKKVNTHVAFPLLLTVQQQPADSAAHPPKGWPDLNPKRSSLVRYELFGVVEHSGTYRDGHYTAFVRVGGSRAASTSQNGERKDGVWNLFSDSKVSAVSEQQVLDAQAFLLFYARVKP